MNINRIHIKHGFYLFPVGILLAISCLSGCTKQTDDSEASNGGKAESSLADRPLTESQVRLLDLAIASSTAIPVNPHLKDRSRAQQAVVTASLELEQPRRAYGYLERIEDWRGGLGLADLALYAARQGAGAEAMRYLREAESIAQAKDIETWRADQIRGRIAQTYAWMGNTQRAESIEAGLESSEFGGLAAVHAEKSEPESFDALVAELDARAATGTFDSIRATADVYTKLMDRYYQDRARRSVVEGKTTACLSSLPLMIRMDIQMKLATISLKHQDTETALRQIAQAYQWLESAQWRPEHRVALSSRLAALRHRAGETTLARAELEAAQSFYHDNRSRIVDIYRAEALRHLARARWNMGDSDAGLDLYRRAVEEGMENPNSRPRAEDLSATCLSMALDAVEPDAELWMRLQQIHQGLGSPW